MAIQLRRGAYGDFDPTKMLPGEVAVVQSGDTENSSSGKTAYLAFGNSTVKRIATEDDVTDINNSITEVLNIVAEDEAEILDTLAGVNTALTSVGTTATSALTKANEVDEKVDQIKVFKDIKVGSSTISADSKTDTLELVAGNRIFLVADTTNDKVTIGAENYSDATTSVSGLMSASDKTKLNGIQNGATKIYYGTCSTSNSTQEKTVNCSDFVLKNGALIIISFSQANTAENPKFNVNSTGAKIAYFRGYPTAWDGNTSLIFRYSSSNSRYELQGDVFPRSLDGRKYSALGGTNTNFTHYAVCSTDGATQEKYVSITGYTLVTGAWIAVKFDNTNTHVGPKLKVGTLTAKFIRFNGASLSSADVIKAGCTYLFVYDGTYWEIVGSVAKTPEVTNGVLYL